MLEMMAQEEAELRGGGRGQHNKSITPSAPHLSLCVTIGPCNTPVTPDSTT